MQIVIRSIVILKLFDENILACVLLSFIYLFFKVILLYCLKIGFLEKSIQWQTSESIFN